MSYQTVLPARILADLLSPNQTLDINRNGAPVTLYRGDSWEFDLGLAMGGSILPAGGQPSTGNIVTVTLQIFASQNDTNAPMVSATTSTVNTALTTAEWAENTSPNFSCSFVIPSVQTAITLNGAASATYWLRVFAQTDDSPPQTTTFLDGPITIKDGPISSLSPPPLAAFRLYSVNGQIVPQILDVSTGLYHTLNLLNDSGVLTLQLSDTGY